MEQVSSALEDEDAYHPDWSKGLSEEATWSSSVPAFLAFEEEWRTGVMVRESKRRLGLFRQCFGGRAGGMGTAAAPSKRLVPRPA